MSIDELRYEHHRRVMDTLQQHNEEAYAIVEVLGRYANYDELVEVAMSNLGCREKGARHLIDQALAAYWMVYNILVG